MAQLPSFEYVHKILSYDPTTGLLVWKERYPYMFKSGHHSAQTNCKRWNTRYAGKEAMATVGCHGYKFGPIGPGNVLLAHRVIWFMCFGYWPKEVDHINRNRIDNRIENLRDVNHSENAKNMTMKSNNKSGCNGVSWNKERGKWEVCAMFNGVRYRLGRFEDKFDAVLARLTFDKDKYLDGHGTKTRDDPDP